jgi:NADH-quinone oxidoreductase subunit G
MADVNITVDGKKLTVPAGTLLIEACKRYGIEIPAFCYYPGLSLQGACRMCLVRIEKVPKLQTACTTVVQEGMIVTTESDEVKQARKAMLELVLANHPLDCPVCDAGGQCELQDMTFKYGAANSKFIDIKNHRDEQQWSPVVFFDRPRCILCYRCVRVCGEGMDVWALGIQQRGVRSVIAPNKEDHLECEECGMCIDICPVGALTSGAYRYQTRPWEMKHVGTACMHCADGCKTTLGVRRSSTGMEIMRGDNRDKSGINGDFLCIKGRYAFDAIKNPERIREPLVRRNGKLVPTSWDEALGLVAAKFKEAAGAIGVVGSNRITNEEAYLLQKFARVVLKTNNIDHHRTADFPAFSKALSGYKDATATMRDVFNAPAMLLIGNDPTNQHPLLAWQIRTNVRLHRARLYAINSDAIKLRRQAQTFLQIPAGAYPSVAKFLAGDDTALDALVPAATTEATPTQPTGSAPGTTPAAQPTREQWMALRDKLKSESSLVIIFGSEFRGTDIEALRRFGETLPEAKFVCLADYANSRGAADMGLYPHLLPGYVPVGTDGKFAGEWHTEAPKEPGLALPDMMKAANDGRIKALYIVGSNPVLRYGVDPFTFHKAFTVVQDLFVTETALAADVVLPAAAPYEKTGTYTNTCGDIQMLKKASDVEGTKSDFEILVRLAERMGYDIKKLVPFGRAVRADMGQSRGAQSGEADRHAIYLVEHGLEPKMSPFDPMALLDEIQRLVPGYDVSRRNLISGSDEHTTAVETGVGIYENRPELIVPSNDTLFTSGSLGRYSNTLNSVIENDRAVEVEPENVSV